MTIEIKGFLRELQHKPGDTVEYVFTTHDGALSMCDWLGRTVEIRVTGNKKCIHCGRSVRKLYQNGYCFPCVTTLAECDLCIVKPHECHFHKGTCRDEQFGQSHCMIPHYVYLAYSSSVKVGLTRKGRQMTRWVDQGASRAILFAEVPTRKLAGELEMEIAKVLPDKTNWRKMLQDIGEGEEDLLSVKREVMERLPEHYAEYVLQEEQQVHRFRYPRTSGFKVNLTSISLDKHPMVNGVLHGIKGQYLMLDTGVLNIKKHAGYEIELSLA